MGSVRTVVQYLRSWGLGVARTAHGFERGGSRVRKQSTSPVGPFPTLDLVRGRIFLPPDSARSRLTPRDEHCYALLHEGAHLLVDPSSVNVDEDRAMLAFEGASVAWLEKRRAEVSLQEWVEWRVDTGNDEGADGVLERLEAWFPELVGRLFMADGHPTFRPWKPDPKIMRRVARHAHKRSRVYL